MSLSVANNFGGPLALGAQKWSMRSLTITCDDSYPSGGWALDYADYGLNGLGQVLIEQPPVGVELKYDRTNKKLMAFFCTATKAAETELDDADLLSGVVVHLTFLGW